MRMLKATEQAEPEPLPAKEVATQAVLVNSCSLMQIKDMPAPGRNS
jgi:hypothetical protein